MAAARRRWSRPSGSSRPACRSPATLIASGAYDEAIDGLRRASSSRSPTTFQALLLRADARMLSRRDYEEALADAERVLELDPDNNEALGAARGGAARARARRRGRRRCSTSSSALYRDDSLGLHGSPALCMARATFAKEKGEHELAEERFDECLEQFPTEALVLHEAIEFFDAIGRPERSDEILDAGARAGARRRIRYRSTLALRLAAAGESDEAKALLRAGTELASPARRRGGVGRRSRSF